MRDAIIDEITVKGQVQPPAVVVNLIRGFLQRLPLPRLLTSLTWFYQMVPVCFSAQSAGSKFPVSLFEICGLTEIKVKFAQEPEVKIMRLFQSHAGIEPECQLERTLDYVRVTQYHNAKVTLFEVADLWKELSLVRDGLTPLTTSSSRGQSASASDESVPKASSHTSVISEQRWRDLLRALDQDVNTDLLLREAAQIAECYWQYIGEFLSTRRPLEEIDSTESKLVLPSLRLQVVLYNTRVIGQWPGL